MQEVILTTQTALTLCSDSSIQILMCLVEPYVIHTWQRDFSCPDLTLHITRAPWYALKAVGCLLQAYFPYNVSLILKIWVLTKTFKDYQIGIDQSAYQKKYTHSNVNYNPNLLWYNLNFVNYIHCDCWETWIIYHLQLPTWTIEKRVLVGIQVQDSGSHRSPSAPWC